MASLRVRPKSVPTMSSTAVSPLATALAQSPCMALTTAFMVAAMASLAPSREYKPIRLVRFSAKAGFTFFHTWLNPL